MARKITLAVPADELKKDLENYRQHALRLGATDAAVITGDAVILDERVAAKCAYPKCIGYGTNANCPPYAMGVDQMRKVVDRFRYGIFVKVKVPSHDIAGKAASKKTRISYQKKLAEIVSRIEAQAFYDGYHLALGFGSGSCKRMFCPDSDCTALVPGKSCPHLYKARSSMEAVGMDAFAMAAGVGWDIYPIGRSTLSEEIPHGLMLGLILVC